MKWYLVLLLFCLMILPAAAAPANFYCSNDDIGNALDYCPACANQGMISVFGDSHALLTLDPGLSTQLTSPIPAYINRDPGLHQFTITEPGYQTYTGGVQVCTKKKTYVTFTLVPVPTTTLVRLARPQISLVPVTTTPGQKIPTTTMTTAPMQDAPTEVTTAQTTDSSGTYLGGSTEIHGPVTGTNPVTTSPPGATTGSLSVTTTPAGAYVFLDGAQRGVSPATISGLAAGDHTLLLKLGGYEDFTTSVTITAGENQPYSTGLVQEKTANTAADAVPTTAKSPGFEMIASLMAIAAILMLRKH